MKNELASPINQAQIEHDPSRDLLFDVRQCLSDRPHHVGRKPTPLGESHDKIGIALVVLDIELPGLRGDLLCQELRAAGVQTPMVALTASAMPDQVAVIRAAGFNEVMTKPVEPRALRAMALRYADQDEVVPNQ